MEIYADVARDFGEYLDSLSENELNCCAAFGQTEVALRNIISHVVIAGHEYAALIHESFGSAPATPAISVLSTRPSEDLEAIITATADAFAGHWEMSDEAIGAVRISAPWGADYALDQLLEHAIVHMLWHRRQCRRVLAQATSQ